MKLPKEVTLLRIALLLLFMYISSATGMAQEKVADFYDQAGKANLTTLWHGPKIYFVGAPDPWDNFPEPLGFIGANYQRFYIHYTSVVKNPSNPYQYLVKGKTKVKNNICSFTGTITVNKLKGTWNLMKNILNTNTVIWFAR